MSLVYFQIVDLLTPLVGTSLGFVPNILNTDVYDEIIQIADDEAVDTFKQLASQKGLSAASVFQVAKQVLYIAPDTRERCLSMNLF